MEHVCVRACAHPQEGGHGKCWVEEHWKRNRMYKGLEINECMVYLGTSILWSVEYKKWCEVEVSVSAVTIHKGLSWSS